MATLTVELTLKALLLEVMSPRIFKLLLGCGLVKVN